MKIFTGFTVPKISRYDFLLGRQWAGGRQAGVRQADGGQSAVRLRASRQVASRGQAGSREGSWQAVGRHFRVAGT